MTIHEAMELLDRTKKIEEAAFNYPLTSKERSSLEYWLKEIRKSFSVEILRKVKTFSHCQKTDLEAIKAEAVKLEQLKGYIPLADDLVKVKADRERLTVECERLEKNVSTSRTKPAEIIAGMEMPIKDLGIDGDGKITIKGLPIKNLSDGEKIILALDIARATLKELKIININGFEALDTKSQELFLNEIQKDQDIQYFISKVADGPLKIESK